MHPVFDAPYQPSDNGKHYDQDQKSDQDCVQLWIDSQYDGCHCGGTGGGGNGPHVPWVISIQMPPNASDGSSGYSRYRDWIVVTHLWQFILGGGAGVCGVCPDPVGFVSGMVFPFCGCW